MSRINYDAKGKRNERAARTWLRANGFPGADRTVRTGAGKDYAHRADEGDLWLCPGVIAQVKSLEPVNRAERAIETWMAETEAQRIAAGADVAVLIVRRPGTADVGEWWAFLYGDAFFDLALFGPGQCRWADFPIRAEVRHVAALLRAAGYGTELEEAG